MVAPKKVLTVLGLILAVLGSQRVLNAQTASPRSVEIKAAPNTSPAQPASPPSKTTPKKPKKAEKSDKKPGEKAKPAEAASSNQRPTDSPTPPDPEELKLRPDKEGRLQFNFKGQPWLGVLEWLAEISKMSLDWNEFPPGIWT